MSEDHAEYNRLWKEQNFWDSIWAKTMLSITGYKIEEFLRQYMSEDHAEYNRLWKVHKHISDVNCLQICHAWKRNRNRFESLHDKRIVISYGNSKGSGELVHPRSLVTYAVRSLSRRPLWFKEYNQHIMILYIIEKTFQNYHLLLPDLAPWLTPIGSNNQCQEQRTSDGNIGNLPIFSGLSQLPWFPHTIIFGIFRKTHVL